MLFACATAAQPLWTSFVRRARNASPAHLAAFAGKPKSHPVLIRREVVSVLACAIAGSSEIPQISRTRIAGKCRAAQLIPAGGMSGGCGRQSIGAARFPSRRFPGLTRHRRAPEPAPGGSVGT